MSHLRNQLEITLARIFKWTVKEAKKLITQKDFK